MIGSFPVDQIGQMTSRIGIVYFSNSTITQATLTKYNSTAEAVAGIYAIPFIGDDGANLEG